MSNGTTARVALWYTPRMRGIDELLHSYFTEMEPAEASVLFEIAVALEHFADTLLEVERERAAEVAERHGRCDIAQEIRFPSGK